MSEEMGVITDELVEEVLASHIRATSESVWCSLCAASFDEPDADPLCEGCLSVDGGGHIVGSRSWPCPAYRLALQFRAFRRESAND